MKPWELPRNEDGIYVECRDWLALNDRYALTSPAYPYHDVSPGIIWQCLKSDLLLERLPPLFVLQDLVQIFHTLTRTSLRRIGTYREELLHTYRNKMLYRLLYADRSVQELHGVMITKGIDERRRYVPYIVRETARTLNRLAPFPFASPDIDACDIERTAETIDEYLSCVLLPAFSRVSGLFTQEQIYLFSYVQSEEDIAPVTEYGRARMLLGRINPILAKKARSSHSVRFETNDSTSPSMGGFAGITSGGSIEKTTSILPSELAMMENRATVDLFDVNLIENRLLSFARDSSVDMRRHRKFLAVFLSPQQLDARPNHIPFRWQYFFMAMLFDIIAFYRNFFSVKHFPFHFVFPELSEEIPDCLRLIELVGRRDFPDVDVTKTCIVRDGLHDYIGELTPGTDADTSIICFVPQSAAPAKEFPVQDCRTRIVYGGRTGTDEIRLNFFDGTVRKSNTFLIPDKDSVRLNMNAIRDNLFLCISGYGLQEADHG